MRECIDSDVFVIELMFPRDPHFKENRAFLDHVRATPGRFTTTLLNKLELLGKLSFGLSEAQLDALAKSFEATFGISLMPLPHDAGTPVSAGKLCDDAIPLIRRKMALADALVLVVAESDPEAGTFITWNARHFRGKTRLAVVTPAEYLDALAPAP